MRTTGGLHVLGDGPTAAMGEGTRTDVDDAAGMVTTLRDGRRRGWAVSMLRGRAGINRDSEPMIDLLLCRVRFSEEEEVVAGAVMERARVISTGTFQISASGSVDDRLRGCRAENGLVLVG